MELNPNQFISTFIECLREYRKQLGDTRSEHDSAYFFNPKLKKFINDHQKEFKLLSTINCERSFIKFCETWFFKNEGVKK